ncbi:MAG: hypothetical protein JW779_04785 [Candidatus Thorarchaeota archaeon]|nr:hypothetical protein [Candidatus Thorarchaeota archaeon]
MSSRIRRDVQTQSTVEAIRMASASVLGSTTGLGYPVGSAMGVGSMLEQHSDTVSMNIAPLIFSIRDTLMSSEGLELLSIEWNLERKPGPGVLPEQLVVTGGSEGGVGSHACILTWEKGVVDPFKIDQYVSTLSKKIGDIESAVINNEMNYELEGLAIIQRFVDRLNRVLFVDMIDRRFQGSWDSFQIKSEHVDIEAIAKMSVYDDFTLLPPGLKISARKSLDFRLPSFTRGDLVDHFQHRVLTPSAIDTLTRIVPETGQAILEEMNTYAYAIEETDVVEGVILVLKEYLQTDSVTLTDFEITKPKIAEFSNHLKDTIDALDSIVEQHISSGKNLGVEEHENELLHEIQDKSDRFDGVKSTLAIALIKELMKSVRREAIDAEEVRAWQLKSTLSYAVAHAKNVSNYFSEELDQYLVSSAAKSAFFTALRDFRQEIIQKGLDSTETMLFEKFYAEVRSQLNAAFSRKTYGGLQYSGFKQMMDAITREMIDSFKHIDVWNLIDFSDVADIARSEIQKKHSVPSPDGALTADGKALMDLLTEFQTAVSDIIPDVADTILSKPLIRRMIEKMKSDGTKLVDELASALEGAGEKSDEWRKEAMSWVEGFRESVDETKSQSESFLTLLQFVHELLGEVVSASAMADRVKIEADKREAVFQTKFNEWQSICTEIESENEKIRERRRRREELISELTNQYDADMKSYEQAVREYQGKLEQRKSAEEAAQDEVIGTVELPPLPVEPLKPKDIQPRIDEIKNEYPAESEKSFPPEPQPEPSLRYHVELRDLLYDKLTELKERETDMEETFAKRILRLQSEGLGVASQISLNIGDDFLEYLKGSRIRSLGRLFPRISRVFLRDPKEPDLLFLVTYEHYDGNLTASIGSTFLR